MKIGSYAHVAEDRQRGKSPWKIYHNPRCKKSREALDLLRANGIDPQIIYYLETPLKVAELKGLLSLLNVEALALIRKNGTLFSELKLDLSKTDDILRAIATHPELLERPIKPFFGQSLVMVGKKTTNNA